METENKSMQIAWLTLLFKWWAILSFVGFLMLFLRDDRKIIVNDLKAGFSYGRYVGVFHFLMLFMLLPLSIPFSLGNILNRWMKK